MCLIPPALQPKKFSVKNFSLIIPSNSIEMRKKTKEKNDKETKNDKKEKKKKQIKLKQ